MRYITLGITLLTGLAPFVAAQDFPRDGDDWVYWDDFMKTKSGGDQSTETMMKGRELGVWWDATKANGLSANLAHYPVPGCGLALYFDNMQWRKNAYDSVQRGLDNEQLQGDERKKREIALGTESYMRPMAVSPFCEWDPVDYPRSGPNGEKSVVFHNRNSETLSGDFYLLLDSLDPKTTGDTANLYQYGRSTIQGAEGADKKVREIWGDIEITPDLLREWAHNSVQGLGRWIKKVDGELQYPNPYHIPRYSKKWENFNALAAQDPVFLTSKE